MLTLLPTSTQTNPLPNFPDSSAPLLEELQADPGQFAPSLLGVCPGLSVMSITSHLHPHQYLPGVRLQSTPFPQPGHCIA